MLSVIGGLLGVSGQQRSRRRQRRSVLEEVWSLPRSASKDSGSTGSVSAYTSARRDLIGAQHDGRSGAHHAEFELIATTIDSRFAASDVSPKRSAPIRRSRCIRTASSRLPWRTRRRHRHSSIAPKFCAARRGPVRTQFHRRHDQRHRQASDQGVQGEVRGYRLVTTASVTPTVDPRPDHRDGALPARRYRKKVASKASSRIRSGGRLPTSDRWIVEAQLEADLGEKSSRTAELFEVRVERQLRRRQHAG